MVQAKPPNFENIEIKMPDGKYKKVKNLYALIQKKFQDIASMLLDRLKKKCFIDENTGNQIYFMI